MQEVREGSDIVAIPYSAIVQPDGHMRLTVYTEMVAAVVALLYARAGLPTTIVVAVGEHTFGKRHTSTTELIYDHLNHHNVPPRAFARHQPQMANNTPEQINWLKRTFGKLWQDHPPVLVGQAQHWPRIRRLCQIYDLSVSFVDAAAFLDAVGKLTPRYRKAVQVFDTDNAGYEAQTMRLTRAFSWLGPAATTAIFRVMSRMRSATVVDTAGSGSSQRLYATTARRHSRRQKKEKQ